MMMFCQCCGSWRMETPAGPTLGACEICGGVLWTSAAPFWTLGYVEGSWPHYPVQDVERPFVPLTVPNVDRLQEDLTRAAAKRPRLARSRAHLRVIDGGRGDGD